MLRSGGGWCGYKGKAFDFECRNIEEVRIILALENLCRQAGQMLYPYMIQAARCQQGVVSHQLGVCGDQQLLASRFLGFLWRVGRAVVVNSVWVKHLTFCEELIV